MPSRQIKSLKKPNQQKHREHRSKKAHRDRGDIIGYKGYRFLINLFKKKKENLKKEDGEDI